MPVPVTSDRDADFAGFVDARWSRLVRFAHLLTGDFHDAEDLVQTTLVKVCARWRHIPAAEADTYVRGALVNNHRSRVRKRRVAQLLTPFVPHRAVRGHADAVETRIAVGEALDMLSVRQRATVVLRFWEDMTEQQTALVLGCSTSTVKVHTRRALAVLRAHPALAVYASVGGERDE
ncbi:SigE family RNA polymerase sigma factor [Streptomyces liangshanensis]|uniref:SigE family RNA polymerase sigma factor n=1 Tax=Streptomyces liangshanensis TaxID=2717324 RepID=UPI0036D858AA